MTPAVSHPAPASATVPPAAPADEPVASVAIGADAIAVPATAALGVAAPADTADKAGARIEAVPLIAPVKTAIAQAGVPAPMPPPASGAGSIGGALFALVLVVGLILLLGWLARRMPGFGGARGNPALRVVGSLALGPRDRVVVVEVGDTQLLLGVGSNGTRTLHTLSEPLPVAPESKTAPAFAQLLTQQFGKKKP